MSKKKISGDDVFLTIVGTGIKFLPALLVGYLLQKVTPWGWAIVTVAIAIYIGQENVKFIAWRYWLVKTRTRGTYGMKKVSTYQDNAYNRKWAFIGAILGAIFGLIFGIMLGFYGLIIISCVELLIGIPLQRWADAIERRIPYE